jgi:hypothetical protein
VQIALLAVHHYHDRTLVGVGVLVQNSFGFVGAVALSDFVQDRLEPVGDVHKLTW